MKKVLDSQAFEGGGIQAIRVDRANRPHFFLVRDESALVDIVEQEDQGLLQCASEFQTEAGLRAAFLNAIRLARRSHARCCTGWCKHRVLGVAERVRDSFERMKGEAFPKWHCHEASVALALALKQCGWPATVLAGRVQLDRPLVVDPDEPDETLREANHWWVDVDGLWIDITADQFQGHVAELLQRVHLLSAEAAGRYAQEGPADTAEYETDDLVLAVLANL